MQVGVKPFIKTDEDTKILAVPDSSIYLYSTLSRIMVHKFLGDLLIQ
jgi:hypothetical protein